MVTFFGRKIRHPCPIDPEKQAQTITLSGCWTVFTVYWESNQLDPVGLCTLLLVDLRQRKVLF
jgi:hypothetical protein